MKLFYLFYVIKEKKEKKKIYNLEDKEMQLVRIMLNWKWDIFFLEYKRKLYVYCVLLLNIDF